MSPSRFWQVNGHEALTLENAHLRVTVLPEKGADIYELVYLPSGIDCLMKTPAGLRPPAAEPAGFLDNYEGGWQELFPNANDACEYGGHAIPFHGEAALRPWRVEVRTEGDAPEARFSADMRLLPFRLVKTLRLLADEPLLEAEYSVENIGEEPLHYIWGEHIVLGAPFLEAGCRFEAAGGTIMTLPDLYEPATATLAPGQRGEWPYAEGRDGRSVDVRCVPGPEARSHDDFILGDLPEGRATVTNERLRLEVDLRWDRGCYRYLQVWTPYGGSDAPPLTGIYGLGIEPYVSRFPLDRAVLAGEARVLAPGAVDRTTLRLRYGPIEGRSR
jgi:galactose mutarotase-like enzyme